MSLISLFDDLIRTTFPLPDLCPENSERGAWHLSPSQHVLEVLIVGVICLGVFLFCLKKFQQELVTKDAIDLSSQQKQQQLHSHSHSPSIIIRILDKLLLGIVCLSAATIIYHKYHGEKMSFLLQPCHILHAFLIYIMLLPRGSRHGNICLAIYLCELSAPFLGTVAVDLSCYTQRFEAINWGVQHVSLMMVPLYLVGTSRFSTRPLSGKWMFGFSFTAQCLLHFPFLVMASIIFGTNINYVLCPPPGQQILLNLGALYRPPMFFFCAILAWTLRFCVVESFVRIVCRNTNESIESSRISPDDDDETTQAISEMDVNAIVDSSQSPSESPSKSPDQEQKQQQQTKKVNASSASTNERKSGLRSRGKSS